MTAITPLIDWRARILDDEGLFSEKEPDDSYFYDGTEYEKGRDYWECLRFHVFWFRADGSFLQFYEDASNHGETYDLREGRYDIEGDQLHLTFQERRHWSNSGWDYSKRIDAWVDADEEETTVTLRVVEGEPTFALAASSFYPIAECPAVAPFRQDLAASLAECRSRTVELPADDPEDEGAT